MERQQRIDDVKSLGHAERRLDALAELLEVYSGSTCIALYVNKNEQVVIASNDLHKDSKGQGRKPTTVQEDKIIKLYNYFRDIALSGEVPSEREDFFKEICQSSKFLSNTPAYYKLLGPEESDKLIRAIINQYSQESQAILNAAFENGGTKAAACSSWLNLYSSFIKLEKELRGCKVYFILENEMPADLSALSVSDTPRLVKCNDGSIKLIFANEDASISSKTIQDLDGSLSQLFDGATEKIFSWESSVMMRVMDEVHVRHNKKSDRKIPDNFFNAFKKDAVILKQEKKSNVHAEAQIAAFLLREERVQQTSMSDSDPKEHYYIGIGKLCCLKCHVFLDEASKSPMYSFRTRGHHDIETAWQAPFYERQNIFLNGALDNTMRRAREILKSNGYSIVVLEEGLTLESGKIYFRIDAEKNFLTYKVIDPSGEVREGTISQEEMGCSIDSTLSLEQIQGFFQNILNITSQRGHTRKESYGSLMEHDASEHNSMNDSQSNPASPVAMDKIESIVALIQEQPAKMIFAKLKNLEIKNINSAFLVLMHLSEYDAFLALMKHGPIPQEDRGKTIGMISEHLSKQGAGVSEETLLEILSHKALVGKDIAEYFNQEAVETSYDHGVTSDQYKTRRDDQEPSLKRRKIAQSEEEPQPGVTAGFDEQRKTAPKLSQLSHDTGSSGGPKSTSPTNAPGF